MSCLLYQKRRDVRGNEFFGPHAQGEIYRYNYSIQSSKPEVESVRNISMSNNIVNVFFKETKKTA